MGGDTAWLARPLSGVRLRRPRYPAAWTRSCIWSDEHCARVDTLIPDWSHTAGLVLRSPVAETACTVRRAARVGARSTAVRALHRITPLLEQLHWLPVCQRIVFKIAGLVHQSLGSAPAYLADVCRLVLDIGCHPLQSNYNDTWKLLVLLAHNKTSWRVSRPPVLDCGTTFQSNYRGLDWPLTPSFRQSLKSHLFGDRSA